MLLLEGRMWTTVISVRETSTVRPQPGQSVGITGDVPSLGLWSPSHPLRMTRDDSNSSWSVSITVPVSCHPRVLFKFCMVDDSTGFARYFEALDSHRVVQVPKPPSSSPPLHCDCGDLLPMVPTRIRHGESEVVLKEVRIPDGVRLVGAFAASPDSRFPLSVGRATPTRVPAATPVAIVVDVEGAKGARGRAVVGADEVSRTRHGFVTRAAVPTSAADPAGPVSVCDVGIAFLVMHAMPEREDDERELEALRGRRPRIARFIGHRGSGATNNDRRKDDALTENTLASFVEASRVPGAGGVEFDVHLTSDGVPVIFHDIILPIPAASASPKAPASLVRVPINKLTHADMLRLRPCIPGDPHEGTPAAIEARKARTAQEDDERSLSDSEPDTGVQVASPSAAPSATAPTSTAPSQLRAPSRRRRRNRRGKSQCTKQEAEFWKRSMGLPTLDEMFTHIPECTGFDVEIKYPDNIAIEQDVRPVERNAYLDRIVGLVMDRSPAARQAREEGRWVIFSSFDVDVCQLISRKQSRVDVFLLTTGNPAENFGWGDNCCCELPRAIETAAALGLRGIVTHARFLLTGLSIVGRAHSLGLSVVTWGIQNANPQTVKQQLDIGVDGIISDYLRRVTHVL